MKTQSIFWYLVFILFIISDYAHAQVINVWEHVVNNSGLKTEPWGFEVDSIGNSWLAISNSSGFNLQHYDSSGNTVWIAGFPVQEWDAEIKSLQKDRYNNLFLFGLFLDTTNNGTFNPINIIKYDTGGNESWRFTKNENGLAGAMSIDDSGNVCFIGSTLDTLPLRPFITKLDSGGNLLWSQNYSIPFATLNVDFIGMKLVNDRNGNIYVCGGLISTFLDSSKIVVLKVSSSGNIIWSQYYPFEPNYSVIDFSNDISHSLLVSTENYDPVSGLISTLVLRYDTSGNLLKATNFPLRASKIYKFSNEDYLMVGDVLQYVNASDSVLWVQTYGNANFKDIFVDNNNSIYVAGMGSDKFVFIKYSINGNLLWAEHYDDNGLALFGSDARYIRKDASGNIYVSGFVKNSDHFDDGHTVTLKYREFNTSIYDFIEQRNNAFVFPNPANSSIMVSFRSKIYTDYTLRLSDISGQTILVNQGKANYGINSKVLDLDPLAKGLYFLNVRVGNESEIIKVVVN